MTFSQTLREAVEFDIDLTEPWSNACGEDWCDGDAYLDRGWLHLPELEYGLLEAFMTDKEQFDANLDKIQGDLFILLVAEALEVEYEP